MRRGRVWWKRSRTQGERERTDGERVTEGIFLGQEFLTVLTSTMKRFVRFFLELSIDRFPKSGLMYALLCSIVNMRREILVT